MAGKQQPHGAAPRQYRSTLRAQRAADTRRRIVDAARELFAAHGFAATTVARIAERAGVAQPTVYATFGGKTAIVHELVERLEQNANAASWQERISGETNPVRKLAHYAAWHRELFASGKDVLAAQLVAGGDAAAKAMHDAGARSSQEWLETIVRTLDEVGALAKGLSRARAIDRAWILTSFEVYARATEGRGWTDDAYQEWLSEVLQQQLLANRDRSAAKR